MKKIIFSIALILVALMVGVINHQKIVSIVVIPPYVEWASQTDALGLENGKRLDEKQLEIASEIGIKHPEKVRIVYVNEVPFPYENLILKTVGEALGFIGEGIINNAQVFGYSIYVRKGYEMTTPRLAHELVHVLQIERANLEQVITQHFSDLANYGYENSPLEAEAFQANEKYKNQ